jgi:hypothetical protein
MSAKRLESRDFARALLKAITDKVAKRPMMAMTTNNSIKVKPRKSASRSRGAPFDLNRVLNIIESCYYLKIFKLSNILYYKLF